MCSQLGRPGPEVLEGTKAEGSGFAPLTSERSRVMTEVRRGGCPGPCDGLSEIRRRLDGCRWRRRATSEAPRCTGRNEGRRKQKRAKDTGEERDAEQDKAEQDGVRQAQCGYVRRATGAIICLPRLRHARGACEVL